MAETPSDLFADLWLQLVRAPAIDLAAREIEHHKAEAFRVTADLARTLASEEPCPRLRTWLNDRGSALEPALLLAQAIDAYFLPLTVVGTKVSVLPAALRDARRRLVRTGRFNSSDEKILVIPRRPLTGRWSDPDMPDTTSGSVAELFMNLVCLPSVITATDPDLPERPRAVSFHYHPPRISNQRPDAPDIWRIGFAAIAEAMVTHRANLYDKSRPLSARCGIGLCIDRSATGPVAKVLEVDVVGATPKSGLVDWDPTNWMSIDVN